MRGSRPGDNRFTVLLTQTLLHQLDDQLIGHQLAGIHGLFHLFPQLCSLLHGSAEQIAGGDGGDSQPVCQ